MVGFSCVVVIGRFVMNGAAWSRNTEPVWRTFAVQTTTLPFRAPQVRRIPDPLNCHSVILRALPEESLHYNNGKIIDLTVLLHQRSFALLRMTIFCFVYLSV